MIDICDEFGVQRTKFQSTEIETVDLTTFLFGFRDAQGFEHRVASRRMKISGNEKSTLFAFLKGLLGRAPVFGWDYCELRGAQCLLTVEHITRRDGTGVFAAIAALSPLPAGYAGPARQETGDRSQESVGRGGPSPLPSPSRGEGVQGAGGVRAPARSVGPAPVSSATVRPAVRPAPAVARPASDAIPF